MKIHDEEKILSECGFSLSVSRAYADEYANKDIVIYTDHTNQINLIVNPEDYVFVKAYDCEKNHNSNLIAYPRELNNGQTPIHYGYKIMFDDSQSMKLFLINYLNYKNK